MKKIVVDADKCTGCRICEIVCAMLKEGSFNYKKARIRLVKIDEKGIDFPVVCKVCESPPCITVCPTRAILKDPATGALIVYYKLCFGCGLCMEVCPIGAISAHSNKSIPAICDLCGGDPACVKYCPTQALTFESINVATYEKRKIFIDTIR